MKSYKVKIFKLALAVSFLCSVSPVMAHASASIGNSPVTSLQSGLVGYWTFDGQDTNWANGKTYDKSGLGNNGTLTSMSSSTTPVPGKLGQALNFNGSNSRVIINSTVIGTTALSLCAWVYPKSFTGTPEVIGNTQTDLNLAASLNAGRINFSSDGGGHTINSGVDTISLNIWQHVCVTRTSSGAASNIYINGRLSGSADQNSGTPGSTGQNTNIGSYIGSSSFFNGYIDEVRVYNRVLLPAEIQRLYQLGAARVANSPVTSLQSGLVGYWTFDGQDTNWANGKTYDKSGLGNNGTLTSMSSSTTPVPGKLGQALNFNGSTTYVDMGTQSTLNLSSAMTACAWMKTNTIASGAKSIVANESSGPISYSFNFLINNTAARLGFSDDGDDFVGDSNTDLKVNTWYHACAVRTGSSGSWTVTFYLNGVNDGKGTTAIDPGNANLTTAIGRAGGSSSQYFNGLIDDVRLYNRALSAAEIQRLYQLGAARVANSPVTSLQSGLVGYWTFDGQHTNWGTGKTYDQSGKGNHGTLTNMSTSTTPVPGKLGQALSFDGVNDYVDAGSSSSLRPTTAGTFVAWIKWNALGAYFTFLSNGSMAGSEADGVNFYLAPANGTKLLGSFNNGSSNHQTVTGNTTLTTGQWYHVALTWDSSNINMYLNGQKDVTQTTQTVVPSPAYNFTIGWDGNHTSGAQTNGVVDEVRVYNRALSAPEIQRLYQMGR